VRLTLGGTPVAKFVAIFGGGIDPADAAKGQNLYMVDIETGKTLWKRAVTGAVPSEPAAVDTDQNGLIDTIYVGTAAGFMYKVNVSQAADVNSTTKLVDNVSQWAPFKIFDTGGRPIFFRPTVVYDSSSGHYALAFGTGDRENLWSDPVVAGGRFYMVLDAGFAPGVAPIASGPLTESNFPIMAADDDPVSGNLILAPGAGKQSGWVLELGDDERVVTDALTVSGLLAFTTFDPQHPDICEFGGSGNIYALLATNANSIGGGESERAIAIEGFAGKPVITSEGFTRQDGQGNVIDPFESADIDGVRQSLMSLFPADCRFGNFSLNVSTSLSSQEVLPLAQIPVCIARKNWTEH